jgi:hypothetical protein
MLRGKESGQGSQMSSWRALSLLITALSCTCLSCTCTESPSTGISTKRARARLEMFLLHLGLWVDGRCRLAPGTQDSFP